ncbi:MAG: YSC84-related protein [Candidatus Omnitrophota bacterium]|jgi:lipid-binding SYLF domain-containing protein
MKTQSFARIAVFVFLTLLFFTPISYAKSAREIDASVDTALTRFQKDVFAAKDMLAKAKGVLILPKVFKAGIGIGGEYGVGALRIKGKTVDYYNIIGGSVGFQFGAQVRNIYLLFMEDRALQNFQSSDGWRAGVDGSVALITIGADGSVDTTKTNASIIAYVLDHKGLMYNLNLEGSKFNKIKPN